MVSVHFDNIGPIVRLINWYVLIEIIKSICIGKIGKNLGLEFASAAASFVEIIDFFFQKLIIRKVLYLNFDEAFIDEERISENYVQVFSVSS